MDTIIYVVGFFTVLIGGCLFAEKALEEAGRMWRQRNRRRTTKQPR